MTEPRTLDTAETADTARQPVEPATDAAPGAPQPPLTTADISSGATAVAGQPAVDQRTPSAAAGSPGTPRADAISAGAAPLFDERAAGELRGRWDEVQAGFVDEPRTAVERADQLVAEVMKRLADSFASERTALEQQWSSGGDASTEDLRIALRRYRSFFDRLLSI